MTIKYKYFFSTLKKYTKNHEWISYTSLNGPITLGISDYGQKAIGDLVYVQVMAPNNSNTNNQAERPIAIVEGVKGATDVYCPFTHISIQSINEDVIKKPSLINKSPENDGYILKFLINNAEDQQKQQHLMDEEEYTIFCNGGI